MPPLTETCQNALAEARGPENRNLLQTRWLASWEGVIPLTQDCVLLFQPAFWARNLHLKWPARGDAPRLEIHSWKVVCSDKGGGLGRISK